MQKTVTPAATVCAVAIVVCLTISIVAAPEQVRDRSARIPDTIQHVEGLEDLTPQTASERRRAEYFDQDLPFTVAEVWNLGGTGITMTGGVVVALSPPPTPLDAEVTRRRVCTADVIVIGKATSRRALLNRSLSWLFTDYTLLIDEWIVPAKAAGSSVVASINNGEAYVGDRLFRTSIAWLVLPLVPLHEDRVFFLGRFDQKKVGPIEGYDFQTLLDVPGQALQGSERAAARRQFATSVQSVSATCEARPQ